jgi:hypothetical protein
MKRISPVLEKVLRHRIKKYLVEDEVVMNWRILKKCILMLTLRCGVHLTWLGWDLFVLFNPEYWQYVHIERVYSQVVLNGSFLLILALLIYPCYKFQGNRLV